MVKVPSSLFQVSFSTLPSNNLLQALTLPISLLSSTIGVLDLVHLPTKGDLVAIDAEFVCVQAEESMITYSGSKEITSEPRNALARLSIINCQTNEVIIDDYVLPREPVVDYLTRFSGIEERDLDAKNSPHHLVTPQEAYLKVRLLMERCVLLFSHIYPGRMTSQNII